MLNSWSNAFIKENPMSKAAKNKIQYLLVKHLLEDGEITLKLPDGMVLNIGITQEGNDGDFHKVSDYCWLLADQHNRTVALDSFNLGLRFQDGEDKIILEDNLEDNEGKFIKHFDIV